MAMVWSRARCERATKEDGKRVEKVRVGEMEKYLPALRAKCLSFHCEWLMNALELEKWGGVGEVCGEGFQVMDARPTFTPRADHSCYHGS